MCNFVKVFICDYDSRCIYSLRRKNEVKLACDMCFKVFGTVS